MTSRLAHARFRRANAAAPRAAPLPPRPNGAGRASGGGPNPLVVIGAAFAAGVLLAKLIDGATARLLFGRGREGESKAKLGRFARVDRH
jgi:hypothetical protein